MQSQSFRNDQHDLPVNDAQRDAGPLEVRDERVAVRVEVGEAVVFVLVLEEVGALALLALGLILRFFNPFLLGASRSSCIMPAVRRSMPPEKG